jgi:uncharacterized protein (TIGR03435 family)
MTGLGSKALLLILGIAAVVVPIFSQAGGAQAPKPSFEVVSIKPAPAVLTRIMIAPVAGGRFSVEGLNLKNLVARAYSVAETRVVGGPNWVESARYNIEAKAEGATIPAGQLQLMLQSMLEDRFQLKAHRETRELPVYELHVARGGVKMKMSEDQTPLAPPAPPSPAEIAAMQAAMRGGGARGAAPAGPPPRGMFNRGNGQMTGTAVPVTTIVNTLAQTLGRPVIDKTGLTGLFDISVQWTPGAEQAPGPFGPPPGGAPPPLDPTGPSIFTALQEQLGLRLESTKGPIDVVVIDSAEKPSEN